MPWQWRKFARSALQKCRVCSIKNLQKRCVNIDNKILQQTCVKCQEYCVTRAFCWKHSMFWYFEPRFKQTLHPWLFLRSQPIFLHKVLNDLRSVTSFISIRRTDIIITQGKKRVRGVNPSLYDISATWDHQSFNVFFQPNSFENICKLFSILNTFLAESGTFPSGDNLGPLLCCFCTVASKISAIS